jgi:hypothetical protein
MLQVPYKSSRNVILSYMPKMVASGILITIFSIGSQIEATLYC